MLTSPSSDYDPKILFVLDQVEAGQNLFPLILVETIHGLDKFAEIRHFSGSSMLPEVSFFPSNPLLLVLLPFFQFIILHRPGFMKN